MDMNVFEILVCSKMLIAAGNRNESITDNLYFRIQGNTNEDSIWIALPIEGRETEGLDITNL